MWTTPRTWVAGEIVTAAVMNTHVRDNLAYIHGDAGATSFADSLLFGASGKGTLRGLRHTQGADYHICSGSVAMPSDTGSGSTASATFDRAFSSTPAIAIAQGKAMDTKVSSLSSSGATFSGGGTAGTWTLYYIAVGPS